MSEFTGYFTQQDSVLENKLGILDPEEMKRIEAEIVPLRITEFIADPPEGEMDYAYLCMVHERIFGDLYPMAGKTREVDIAKGSSAFCYVQFIGDEQKRIFRQMHRRFSQTPLDRSEFVRHMAWLGAELNALHPFREGNGRAIRTFMVVLALRSGYHLDYSAVSEELRMNADIAAFSGNMRALEQVYDEMIQLI